MATIGALADTIARAIQAPVAQLLSALGAKVRVRVSVPEMQSDNSKSERWHAAANGTDVGGVIVQLDELENSIRQLFVNTDPATESVLLISTIDGLTIANGNGVQVSGGAMMGRTFRVTKVSTIPMASLIVAGLHGTRETFD